MSTTTLPARYTADDVARAHAETQQQIRGEAIAVALAVYATTDPADIFTSWFTVLDDILAALFIGESLLAAEASEYVRTALAVQGYAVRPPTVNADAFASQWSDGRPTEEALFSVPWEVYSNAGVDLEQAKAHGELLLTTMLRTEMADTGRDADAVALAAAQPAETLELPVPPTPTAPARTDTVPLSRRERRDMVRMMREAKLGWVRMLTLPSCGRCAILAGKWYPWSDGFERHPNCDCRHIPAMEADEDDLTTDPKAYFDSLSEADQARYFGKANAEAIRAGGDIFQVMNAATRPGSMWIAGDGRRYTREGTTRRGYYRTSESGRRGERRPTPYQIMRESNGDRAAAVTQLRRFGYIV